MSLIDLLKQYGSDKADEHSYGEFYESVLQPHRDRTIKILEIGIFRGASLRAFRDYLPLAEIHGVDINPSFIFHGEERIRTHLADQTDDQSIGDVCREYGPFSLIIDDGSHVPEHQRHTFKAIRQYVAPGGVYVIEDVVDTVSLSTIPGARVVDLRWRKNRHDDVLLVIDR